jgi:formate dehydrogenase major subunit
LGGRAIDLWRRDFLRISASAAAGTALGGLVGLGTNLGPATAWAQELRIKDAKTTPSVCPYCSVGCATLVHTIDGNTEAMQMLVTPVKSSSERIV